MHLTIVQKIAMLILPLLFAVTAHEVAHGYMAYLLGDRTAKALGRLTLNPVRHIDPIGTIVVPIISYLVGGIVIGWAKPVPITVQNLKNPRWGFALISLAGPGSNFIMALIWAAVAKLGLVLMSTSFPGALAVYMIGSSGITINLMLGLLNLIPIPPLDGGHIISSILPRSLAIHYDKIAPYGFFIIFGLVFLGFLNSVLWPMITFLNHSIIMLFGLAL